MSRFALKMLVMTVLFSAISVSVMAQTKEDDPFRFSIGVSAEFTDNRDSSVKKQNNADYYIGPKFEFKSKPGESSTMSIYYSPEYRYRTKPSTIQNDAEFIHNASVDYRKKSSEIQELRVQDFFAYTDDPSVNQDGTLMRRDSSFIYNFLEMGTHRKLHGSDAMDLSGYYSFKKYDETEVAQQSDEDRYNLSAQYLKQYQRRSALAFELQLGGTSYKELAGANRSYMTAIGSVGMEHIASPNLRMGARLGAQIVDYKDAELGTATAPAVNLSIVGSTIPTVTFTGTIDHRIRESDVFPFASQEATDFRGAAEWTLKEQNIVLTGAVTLHTGAYSQDALPGTSFASADGNENSVMVEGVATYKFKADTTVGIALRHEDVRSEDGMTYTREFTRNAATFSVVKQF